MTQVRNEAKGVRLPRSARRRPPDEASPRRSPSRRRRSRRTSPSTSRHGIDREPPRYEAAHADPRRHSCSTRLDQSPKRLRLGVLVPPLNISAPPANQGWRHGRRTRSGTPRVSDGSKATTAAAVEDDSAAAKSSSIGFSLTGVGVPGVTALAERLTVQLDHRGLVKGRRPPPPTTRPWPGGLPQRPSWHSAACSLTTSKHFLDGRTFKLFLTLLVLRRRRKGHSLTKADLTEPPELINVCALVGEAMGMSAVVGVRCCNHSRPRRTRKRGPATRRPRSLERAALVDGEVGVPTGGPGASRGNEGDDGCAERVRGLCLRTSWLCR